ncbi:MAG: EAL domain-containing response regulator [Hylemonella sp.]
MSKDINVGRVLVIDDDPLMLQAIELQLSRLGVRDAVTCESASEALMKVFDPHQDAFTLVICDLQMPVMDGVEFVRRLADGGFAGGLMLLSGEDARTLQAATLLAKTYHLNFLGSLSKPVPLDRLRQALEGFEPSIAKAIAPDHKSYTPEQLAQGIDLGQMVIYYQPKVSVQDGTLFGLEAMVRWEHPQDGLISPDHFITLAEDNDLIDRLTQEVLEQSVRQIAQWRQHGLVVKVSVNVSMDNLHALDFPEMLAKILQRNAVDPRQLVLEITESRLMHNPNKVLDIVTRLRLKRIGLALDDFGTGHSSLAQLRDMPFDELKLDRSFVHDAVGDTVRAAILHGSIQMARQLQMDWVAEGVEDRADWRYLRQFGGGYAQGYFVSKPMLPGLLQEWLGEWQKRFTKLAAEDVLSITRHMTTG